MKLNRKLILELLETTAIEVAKKDKLLWEILVAALRKAADTIEKFEKE
jgi:hypothetical protein